jgi:hypothetical protein
VDLVFGAAGRRQTLLAEDIFAMMIIKLAIGKTAFTFADAVQSMF